jgi:hypothetical protein
MTSNLAKPLAVIALGRVVRLGLPWLTARPNRLGAKMLFITE